MATDLAWVHLFSFIWLKDLSSTSCCIHNRTWLKTLLISCNLRLDNENVRVAMHGPSTQYCTMWTKIIHSALWYYCRADDLNGISYILSCEKHTKHAWNLKWNNRVLALCNIKLFQELRTLQNFPEKMAKFSNRILFAFWRTEKSNLYGI